MNNVLVCQCPLSYEQNCSLCSYGIKTIKSGPQGYVPPDKLVYEVKRSPCQSCLPVLLLAAFALWLFFRQQSLWLEQLFHLWDRSAVFCGGIGMSAKQLKDQQHLIKTYVQLLDKCFLNIFCFLSSGFLVLSKFAQTVVVYGYLCSSLTLLLCLRPINTLRDGIMR